MSDDYSVKTPPPIFSGVHLTSEGVACGLNLPRLHLRIGNRPRHDASGAASAITTAGESTASSSTTLNPSSRTPSAEPTESPTSSSEPPSPGAFSASVPPSSPTRVPARLRRKCPMYMQFEKNKKKQVENGGDGDGSAAEKNVCAAKIEEDGSPAWTSATGAPSVAPDPDSKAARSTQRKRIPAPVPVPHLIKKSRGRRVPESDGAQERTHICTVPGCSKSFARAEHLKRHVLSLHTHEKRTFPIFHWPPCCELICGWCLSCSFRVWMWQDVCAP